MRNLIDWQIKEDKELYEIKKALNFLSATQTSQLSPPKWHFSYGFGNGAVCGNKKGLAQTSNLMDFEISCKSCIKILKSKHSNLKHATN